MGRISGLTAEGVFAMMGCMKKGRVTLTMRISVELAEKLSEMAEVAHMSRSAFVGEAIRVFLARVKRNGGFIVPPYRGRRRL